MRYLYIALLLVSGNAFAQSKQATIDSMINRTHRLGLFNGNILVIDHGKPVYQTAVGFTDASQKIQLTANYRFHIGSVAKEFNAVAIMMLNEQGKLKLDDKLSRYVSGLPAWAGKVSIRNLLQYTSGIPNANWRELKNDADAMAAFKKIDTLEFEPGTKYNYNNSNTFFQRRVIEKLSGMPFNQFVEQKMLKPLKMTEAVIDPDEKTPLMAMSYNNNMVQSPMFSPISGWTALTLADFYKWELAIEDFKLISPASTREIITPFALNNQCGLGGGTMEGNKIITHQHDGTSLNYQALLLSNVPAGRTVILMTNNKQNNLYDIDRAIQAILDGKPYQQPKKPVLAGFQKQLDTLTAPQIIAFYTDLKAKHANEYGFENESTLNEIGYFLMGKKKTDDAITIFEYNTRLFPRAGNLYDSLGEAYYAKGDKANALINYKKAYQLDPANAAAKAVVAELEKK